MNLSPKVPSDHRSIERKTYALNNVHLSLSEEMEKENPDDVDWSSIKILFSCFDYLSIAKTKNCYRTLQEIYCGATIQKNRIITDQFTPENIYLELTPDQYRKIGKECCYTSLSCVANIAIDHLTKGNCDVKRENLILGMLESGDEKKILSIKDIFYKRLTSVNISFTNLEFHLIALFIYYDLDDELLYKLFYNYLFVDLTNIPLALSRKGLISIFVALLSKRKFERAEELITEYPFLYPLESEEEVYAHRFSIYIAGYDSLKSLESYPRTKKLVEDFVNPEDFDYYGVLITSHLGDPKKLFEEHWNRLELDLAKLEALPSISITHPDMVKVILEDRGGHEIILTFCNIILKNPHIWVPYLSKKDSEKVLTHVEKVMRSIGKDLPMIEKCQVYLSSVFPSRDDSTEMMSYPFIPRPDYFKLVTFFRDHPKQYKIVLDEYLPGYKENVITLVDRIGVECFEVLIQISPLSMLLIMYKYLEEIENTRRNNRKIIHMKNVLERFLLIRERRNAVRKEHNNIDQ